MRHHLLYLEPLPQRIQECSQLRTNALEPRECEKSTKWGSVEEVSIRAQSQLFRTSSTAKADSVLFRNQFN